MQYLIAALWLIMFGNPECSSPGPSCVPCSVQSLTSPPIGLWAGGYMAIVLRRFRQWRPLYEAGRHAQPVAMAFPVPPVKTDSILSRASESCGHLVASAQAVLSSILNYVVLELCLVRCRVNVTAAVHMAVEAVSWFYPSAWWVGE
jgi:hypothetical protein